MNKKKQRASEDATDGEREEEISVATMNSISRERYPFGMILEAFIRPLIWGIGSDRNEQLLLSLNRIRYSSYTFLSILLMKALKDTTYDQVFHAQEMTVMLLCLPIQVKHARHAHIF